MSDERYHDLTALTAGTTPDGNAPQSAGFLRAQEEALRRFQRRRPPEVLEVVCHDESEAITAALRASKQDEEVRLQRKRRREEEEQEKLARALQRQEQAEADQELAQALEDSAEEAQLEVTAKSIHQALSKNQANRGRERQNGSWDCGHCTFENQPYEPQCGMCDKPPPPNALVFQPIPTSTRFGLELELIIPDGQKDGFSLDWLASELTKLGPPSVVHQGYTHQTLEKDWKVLTDSSLRGNHPRGDLCLEVVSPILQGKDGLVQLRVLMEHLRRLGVSTNRTCGFHVHVDATSLPLSSMRRVAQCFAALENAFDLLVASKHRSTDQNQFCRSNRIAFGSLTNKQRWERLESAQTPEELVDCMNPDNDRYRKLNLTNVTNPSRPSTMEFRLHGGVQELQEAEAWVRLLLRFCDLASNGGANNTAALARIQTLSEGTKPCQELAVLWDLVDCPGLYQFYAMHRKLYEAGKLQNKWRCHRCRRPFDTSRALSQHVAATGHER